MSNIIDVEEVGWQTSDYIDSRLTDGTIHQHLVKVSDYVASEGLKTSLARAKSEKTAIGAYEYAPGGWITAHSHPRHEQWYYIIKGKGLFKVGSEEKIAQEGSIVFMPRNIVHSYKVVGDEPLRFLTVGISLPEE